MMRREWSLCGTDWKFWFEAAVPFAPSTKRFQAHQEFAEIAARFSGESIRIAEKKKAAKVSRHVIGARYIEGQILGRKIIGARAGNHAA